MSLAALKYDFIQTEEKVVVYVLIRNAEELNCKVTIEPERLLVEAGGDHRLELNLLESINAEKSSYKFDSFKVDSVKVEITLIKLVGRHWAELTKEKALAKSAAGAIYKQDWDVLAKSIIEKEFGEVSCRLFFLFFLLFSSS